tara:strand:- start:4868 stop:5029 length:162 start_codon:yes stop_codon:yes gene_type:complete
MSNYYNNVIKKEELALTSSSARKPRYRWNKCKSCGQDVNIEFKTICEECNEKK